MRSPGETSAMDAGQTWSAAEARESFRAFFAAIPPPPLRDGGPSLHHRSGSLDASAGGADGSAFRREGVRATFPPLSASVTASAAHPPPPQPHHRRRNADASPRGAAGGRALGTSRTVTGAAAGSSTKRRNSLTGVDEGLSRRQDGQQHHQQQQQQQQQPQRQTLKLADITEFDLTARPSAFDKLAGLYRDKSTLDVPSSHLIVAGSAGDAPPKPTVTHHQKGSAFASHHNHHNHHHHHHVHLPRISTDSSPPLVSFRHSRIKPSTLTGQETGLPGSSHRRLPHGHAAPAPRVERRTSARRPDHQLGAEVGSSSVGSERRGQGNDTAATPFSSSATPIDTTASPLREPGSHSSAEIVDPSPTTNVSANPKNPVNSKTNPSSNSEIHLKATGISAPTPGEDIATSKPIRAASSPPPEPATSRVSDSTSRDPYHRGDRATGADVGGLSLSEYTAIVIHNDGWTGQTLSSVRDDSFTGERRTVRFSVSNEVIEYEPESSLVGPDYLQPSD